MAKQARHRNDGHNEKGRAKFNEEERKRQPMTLASEKLSN